MNRTSLGTLVAALLISFVSLALAQHPSHNDWQAYHSWRAAEHASYQTTPGTVYQAWRQAEQTAYRQHYHHAYQDAYHTWRHSERLLHQQEGMMARRTKFRM